MTSEVEKIRERNQRGCGSMQQKNDIAYLLELLDARDRAHAQAMKAAQEALDLTVKACVKHQEEYDQLEKEISAVREERDRLKKAASWFERNDRKEIERLEAELAKWKNMNCGKCESLRAALRELIRVCRYGSSGPESLPALYNRLEALALTPEAAGKA